MTQETPIQRKDKYFLWEELENHAAEKAYRNRNGDLLYVEDTYSNGLDTTQSGFEDFEQDRYKVKIRRGYQPATDNGETIHTSMDWQETQEFLDGITE